MTNILNTIKDANIGSQAVDRIYLGDQSIWIRQPDVWRGIAVAGGSFNDGRHSGGSIDMTNASPGSYGTDWFYDVDGITRTSTAGLAYLRSRGIRAIRIDFRWERLQPTLNAALDGNEVSRLSAMLDACEAVGLKAVLECHNYGHYKAPGAPNLSSAQGGWSLGQPALPYTAFADLWQRIVTQWAAHPAILAWEIMNEPTAMQATGGYIPTTTFGSFDSEAGADRTTNTAPGALLLTSQGQFDGAGGSADFTGYTHIGVWAKITAESGGFTTVGLRLQDPSYNYSAIGADTIIPADGAWHLITADLPAQYRGPGNGVTHRQIAIYIGGTSATRTVHVDDMSGGTMSAATSAVAHWQTASQQALSAIRVAETTVGAPHHRVYAAGYDWQKVSGWSSTNGAPWLNDPFNNLHYAAHAYWNSSRDSVYGTESPAGISGSLSAHTTAIRNELSDFTGWLTTHNVRGAITEMGWPDNAAASDWNSVAQAFYDACDTHNLDVFAWATGAAWGNYELAAYEATPGSWHNGDQINTRNTQAPVIEAHPSYKG